MIASSTFPGLVILLREHESSGPTGWYQNENNRAVGWYWFQCNPRNEELAGLVFKRRADAQADAERQFPNITGWKKTALHKFTALVR